MSDRKALATSQGLKCGDGGRARPGDAASGSELPRAKCLRPPNPEASHGQETGRDCLSPKPNPKGMGLSTI